VNNPAFHFHKLQIHTQNKQTQAANTPKYMHARIYVKQLEIYNCKETNIGFKFLYTLWAIFGIWYACKSIQIS